MHVLAFGVSGQDTDRLGTQRRLVQACRWDAAAGPPQPPLLQLLRNQVPGLGVCDVHSHLELLQQLHLKLAVNCCINPTTALLGCENGAMAAAGHNSGGLKTKAAESMRWGNCACAL
jgi:hypothetical protein